MKKIKPILTKYKSHLVTALIVAIIFYALGHTIAFNEDLSWVYQNKNNTEELIHNFQKTYGVQKRITEIYTNSLQELLECIAKNKSCDVKQSLEEQNSLASERNLLMNELEKLNQETGNFIKGMGY